MMGFSDYQISFRVDIPSHTCTVKINLNKSRDNINREFKFKNEITRRDEGIRVQITYSLL